MRIAVALGTLWLVAAGGCGTPGAVQSTIDPAIWDVHAQRLVSAAELEQRLVAARFRLLGEVHDNPAHHRIRARLIAAIAASGQRPAVVMEQFDLDHEAALRSAQANNADVEAIVTAGGFDRRGWSWPLHAPVIEAAVAAGLPLHAGNVSRAQLQDAMRRGERASLDPAWIARVNATTWSDAQRREQDEEIVESHCGKLPASMVPQLAFAQRVRDAAMAVALASDATSDGAILIAGNGHVRRSLGAPAYFDAAARERTVSVGLVEARPDERRSPVAIAALAQEQPGYDYVWLTPRVERPDPCTTFAIRTPPAAAP
jgi:uncharacterized iron-regulated protein